MYYIFIVSLLKTRVNRWTLYKDKEASMDAVFNTALLSFHKKKIRHEILFILYLILYRYFDAEIFSFRVRIKILLLLSSKGKPSNVQR